MRVCGLDTPGFYSGQTASSRLRISTTYFSFVRLRDFVIRGFGAGVPATVYWRDADRRAGARAREPAIVGRLQRPCARRAADRGGGAARPVRDAEGGRRSRPAAPPAFLGVRDSPRRQRHTERDHGPQ